MQFIGRIIAVVVLLGALTAGRSASAAETAVLGFDKFELGAPVEEGMYPVLSNVGSGPSAVKRVLLDVPILRLTSGEATCVVVGSVVDGRLEGITLTSFDWRGDEEDFDKQMFADDLVALLLSKYEGLEIKNKRQAGATNLYISDQTGNQIWLGWAVPHLNVEYSTAHFRQRDLQAAESEIAESESKF